MKPLVVILLCAATTLSSAIPKPNGEHKSSIDRIQERDLSEQEHYEAEAHNSEYDHEAFLGDQAHSFDNLSPEESKERLGVIYDKIDKDKDGEVTEDELVDWIKYVQNRYITQDTDRQWAEFGAEEFLEWGVYKKRTYGFEDVEESKMDEDSYDYKDMIRRDKRRWELADGDHDGKLTKTEYSHFLHPEEVEHMRSIVIDETLEDIDKNKDGVIDLDEYIGLFKDDKFGPPRSGTADMWPAQEDEEPDWVKTEREQFQSFRDKNNDGKMDREEVQNWIIPPDYDHSEAEAKHLVFEADLNRDGRLSKEEVLNKYDLFVGSQATDFGEALTRHDEF